MRIEIAGDGEEHLLNQGREGSRFVFGSGGGVSKLANGIQAAFEGEAFEIHIMGQGSFLHDAANEVAGNKVHMEFAFDHVRSQASQDVHIEKSFNFAKMKFNAETS